MGWKVERLWEDEWPQFELALQDYAHHLTHEADGTKKDLREHLTHSWMNVCVETTRLAGTFVWSFGYTIGHVIAWGVPLWLIVIWLR